MNHRLFSLLFNIVWFQACWFACVLVGNKAALIIASLVLGAYLVVNKLRSEWPLLIGVSLLGLMVDVSLLKTGVLSQSTNSIWPPLWLSVLWLVFATTINHSLKPLMGRRFFFLLLAFIGGPLCYQLGVNLTDIQFGLQRSVSLMIIAFLWLVTGFIILTFYEVWKNHFAY